MPRTQHAARSCSQQQNHQALDFSGADPPLQQKDKTKMPNHLRRLVTDREDDDLLRALLEQEATQRAEQPAVVVVAVPTEEQLAKRAKATWLNRSH